MRIISYLCREIDAKEMIHSEYNPDICHSAAARLGLVVAGIWAVSFLLVVNTFPSLLCQLGYLLGLFPILVVRKNLGAIKTLVMPMTWLQGLVLCLLSFGGGALITTLVQFVYFAWFDHGQFLSTMLENLKDPEMVKAMKEMGNGDMLAQMTTMIGDMSELTPRQLTMQFFSTNLTFSLLFSLLASLVRGKKS